MIAGILRGISKFLNRIPKLFGQISRNTGIAGFQGFQGFQDGFQGF